MAVSAHQHQVSSHQLRWDVERRWEELSADLRSRLEFNFLRKELFSLAEKLTKQDQSCAKNCLSG